MPTDRKREGKAAAFYKAREEFLLALAQADVNPAALRVGLILATRFNWKSWQTDPSVNRLAEATGTDRRTVQRGIASLREAGIVGFEEGRGQGNRHTFRLLTGADKRRQDCHPLEEDEGRQDCRLLDEEKAAILAAKGGNFGRERRQNCRPDTIGTPSGTQGAAASSGGPPMATVSPTSTVVEDNPLPDAQTGEGPRLEGANPPPAAKKEKGKPKYPKDWAAGLSDEQKKTEIQRASEEWHRLLDEGDDGAAITAALWRYHDTVQRAEAQGDMPYVPPPSQWFRERWFERPEWWAPASGAHRRSSTIQGD